MKKLSFLLTFLVLVCFHSQAQTTITGMVTSSEDGAPIPGASIRVQGTSTGTVTEADGNFSLQVPDDAEVLVFSFVGMKTQEVSIDDRTTINVQLEPDILGLDEVVVTALGISKDRKSLGYSVQDVGGDELNTSIQNDALSALSGKVSGVHVKSSSKIGGSQRILIRGANSITGENQPLIVVDGIPMDNSDFNNNAGNGYGGDANGFGGYDYGNMLNDINPEDIANISVLKGPAAAIYGSRAANGVIVITTKKAEATAGQESFGVDVSSSVDFEQVYMIPPQQTKYGGGAIIGAADGGVNGFQQISVGGNNYLIPQYQVDESWGPKYNENINVLHWDAWSQESYPDQYLQPRSWVAPEHDVIDFYELGNSYTNNIAMHRAADDYGVRFSYTNTTAKGTMPNSKQNKNNFSLSGNADVTNFLDVDATVNYNNSYTKGRPQIGYGDNSVGQKFYQWGQRQLDYERLEDYKNDDGTQRTWNRQAWDNPTPQYSDNPYWAAYENYPEDERDRFYGKFSLRLKLADNLFAKGTVYGDHYSFNQQERIAVGSQAQSKYYEAVRRNSEFNYEGILTYSRQFRNFNITAFGGANQRNWSYDFNRANTSGGLVVPGIYNVRNTIGNALVNDITQEKQINSLFGSFSFDINEMFFVEATARNDWSSTLPEDENSYFYPGVSTSLIFSELVSIPYLELGKIRASWAQVGNDANPYSVAPIYNYDSDGPFQGNARLSVDLDLPNTELLPELTTSTEVGIDLVALDSRVSFAATYFSNVTTDQIMPLEISKASGYDRMFINAGQMTNQGVELSLGLVPVSMNNFQWTITTNYSKINNTLDELDGETQAIDLEEGRAPFGGVYVRASVGNTYGMLWGHDFIYDDAGNKVVGSNGYWMQTPNLVPLGSVLPDYNVGIRNTFKLFKQLSIDFLFDIQQGGNYYSLSHMWGMYSGMWEETAATNDKGNDIREPVDQGGGIKLDGVTGDVTFNDDGTYTVTNTAENTQYVSGKGWSQRHYHGFGFPSAQSVFEADYIKLRELTIGYTIPSKVTGPIKNVRVSLYGRNLMTFGLDWEGFDPEMTVNASGNIQGIDGGFFPSSRTFGLNLKFSF